MLTFGKGTRTQKILQKAAQVYPKLAWYMISEIWNFFNHPEKSG